MPGRKYEVGSGYRYGFNGKENDNEVKGEGEQQDYGMRIYDPRLGRFLSVDPITRDYPWLTPYQFASNSNILGIDRDGLEFGVSPFWFVDIWLKVKFGDVDAIPGTKSLMDGAVRKAQIESGDAPWQNENVPSVVQKKIDEIETSRAEGEIVKGTVQTTKFIVKNSAELSSTIIPLGEVVDFGAKGLWNLIKASPKARTLVEKYAAKLIASSSKEELPRAVSAIVNRRTGSVYYGKSGVLKSVEDINPDLKKLLPKESLEKWSVTNCAECDALNQALKNGADIKDLEMHTVKIDKKTGVITDFERCENCKITTKDIKTTSDRRKP